MGGTCPAGSWSGSTYTTGAVTANCTVTFGATINTYTVTPSGTNVTISPSSAQTVNYNTTQAFTVTASTGYTLSSTVGGTCAAGSWSGSTYTTGAVTANCTVSFSATLNTYTVTPSGDSNETISPSSPQTVGYNTTQAFTVTANTGYTLSSTVGGTCPAGSWSGSTYTTGAVTANCSVSFSSTINTYTITPSGTNVTISPSSAQTVNYNANQAFTVTATSGTLFSTVGGTCPAGSWSGSTYTTGAVTANCTVTFSAGAAYVTPFLVQSFEADQTGSPSVITVAPIGTGDLIVIGFNSLYGDQVTSITDDATGGSNTYVSTGGRATTSSGGNSTEIWYAINKGGASNITVNWSGSDGYAQVWFAEYWGINTSSPLDTSAVGVVNNGTSTTTLNGAVVSTSIANEVLVSTAMVANLISQMDASSPFIPFPIIDGNDMAYYIASSQGSYGAVWDDADDEFSSSTAGFVPAPAGSVTPYSYAWTGQGSDSNWSTGGNWGGGSPPSSSNMAIFSPSFCTGTQCNVTISSDVNIAGISIFSGYTGTITQSSGTSMTVGSWSQAGGTFTQSSGTSITVGSSWSSDFHQSSGTSITVGSSWSQSGGTFVGSSSSSDTMTINPSGLFGFFTLSGGSFTSTAGTLTLMDNYNGIYEPQYNFVVSGGATFNANSGTVHLLCGDFGVCNLSPNGISFDNLNIEGGFATTNMTGTATVNGQLTFTWDYDAYTCTPNGAGPAKGMFGGTLLINGDIVVANTGNQNNCVSTAIQLGGSASQSLTNASGKPLIWTGHSPSTRAEARSLWAQVSHLGLNLLGRI